MTRNIVSLLLILLSATGIAFAHGGKTHHLLGTVKAVGENGLVVTATDGHEVTVALTAETRYERDGKPATRKDLAAGMRVSLNLTEDDRTATLVKIAPAPK